MRKIKLLVLLAIGLSVSSSCTKKLLSNPYSNSAVINHEAQGLVTLRGVSDEFPNNSKDEGHAVALKNAQQKALEQLFYMGFPGTDFKNPMIRKGKSVETENKAFFDKFWKGDYKQFITSSNSTFYTCADNKKCVSAVVEFKLNYNALRTELERNKVLNKIGF
ncbi:hypothetical protein [Pedobacter gandavensis]|uniref:Lipoprotein n=1 Tax=Pedobacter gandavensis TaxID=2679963 RepID=A0ABR6F2Z7_9SPHI|nr:hypothetical protein [Pedobacter gandavensis]MBB2151394.1 hypothetical protein [Pedobacter gandavensis]